jgi:adrenodoxin-NADP+ reductase
MFPEDLKSLSRARRRIAELLVKSGSSGQSNHAKTFSLEFLLSPIEFKPSYSNNSQLSSIDFQRTRFTETSDMFESDAKVVATSSSEPVNLAASAAFRSIGYKSEPLPGFADLSIPFDHSRGVIPNQLGRVISRNHSGTDVMRPVSGMYVAGWVKRGPTGVIASTMEDAFATADSILHDLSAGQPLLNHEDGESTGLGWAGVKKAADINGLKETSWRDWTRIDEVERERGVKLGKVREKVSDVDEMLEILHK